MNGTLTAFRAACAIGLLAFSTVGAAQQAYPNKPIRIIVPAAPGGAFTLLARLVGDHLTKAWGVNVLTDNRPGAGAVIGTQAMVKSAPDGYTVLVVGPTHTINAVLLPNAPYDSIRDFAAVASLADTQPMIVASPSLPAESLQNFITLLKRDPGKFNYASTGGTSSSTYLYGAYFSILTGTQSTTITYNGSGPVLVALLAGQVDFFITPPAGYIESIKAGRLKALAVGGNARFTSLPDTPTFAEAGLPAFQLKGWYGVLAPAATPRPIIDKLSAEIAVMLKRPETREFLGKQELAPFITSPEEFSAFLKADIASYAKIVKEANIKPGE